MDAASNLAERSVRAALGFHRTRCAVGLPGSEDDGVGFGDVRPLRCDADAMITPFFFAPPRKLHEEFIVWEEHPIINRSVLPTLGSPPPMLLISATDALKQKLKCPQGLQQPV